MAKRYKSRKRAIARDRRSRSIGESRKHAFSSPFGLFFPLQLSSARRQEATTAPRQRRRASGARISSSPYPAGMVKRLRIWPEDDAIFANKSTVFIGGSHRSRGDWANAGAPVMAKIEASSASMSTITMLPFPVSGGRSPNVDYTREGGGAFNEG